MGMAASQGRFLQLTARKNSIGLQLTRLSNEKVSLSRDMQNLTREYREALSTKTLKWSNNAGVSYVDLSYSNLMNPSEMNQNIPYLLTNASGNVVIASNYEKYAAMISPNGEPGGDWEGNRTQILSELTGIDASTIENFSSYDIAIVQAGKEIDNAKKEKDNIPKTGCKAVTAETMLETLGKSSSLKDTWKKEYSKSNSKVELGSDNTSAVNKLGSILNDLKALAPHLGEYAGDFEKAIENVKNEFDTTGFDTLKKNKDPSEENSCYYKDGKFYANITTLVDYVFAKLPSDAISANKSGYQGKSEYYFWAETSDYDAYKKATESADAKIAAAQAKYNSAATNQSQSTTSNEERLIKFYDELFSTIAERGWEKNDSITDTSYLNEMLQNNMYMITTVSRESKYNDKSNDFEWTNEYSTDIASNFNKVYPVNDKEVQNQAMADYEYQKSIINTKETRIDTRMDNLQTEQSAIQQKLQGLDQVTKDNIERTFNTTG